MNLHRNVSSYLNVASISQYSSARIYKAIKSNVFCIFIFVQYTLVLLAEAWVSRGPLGNPMTHWGTGYLTGFHFITLEEFFLLGTLFCIFLLLNILFFPLKYLLLHVVLASVGERLQELATGLIQSGSFCDPTKEIRIYLKSGTWAHLISNCVGFSWR